MCVSVVSVRCVSVHVCPCAFLRVRADVRGARGRGWRARVDVCQRVKRTRTRRQASQASVPPLVARRWDGEPRSECQPRV